MLQTLNFATQGFGDLRPQVGVDPLHPKQDKICCTRRVWSGSTCYLSDGEREGFSEGEERQCREWSSLALGIPDGVRFEAFGIFRIV